MNEVMGDIEIEAANFPLRRKTIHRAIAQNPDGRRQAANSNHAPFSLIAKGGKGAEQYQGYVLTFLDPTVWDREAPTTPGVDGFMRARPEQAAKRCRNPNGSWRKLICFSKLPEQQQPRYIYIGTYELVTENEKSRGELMIGEFDFPPYQPDSKQGKVVLNVLMKQDNASFEEALKWLNNPKKWRSTPIRFVEFDRELFQTLRAMEEQR